MSEMSPATALRTIHQAQAGLKKARQLLKSARAAAAGVEAQQRVLKVGWEGLTQANRLLATIPLSAADDDVMTKQLALQRYATSLLVRLRRVARNEPGALEGLDDGDDEEG